MELQASPRSTAFQHTYMMINYPNHKEQIIMAAISIYRNIEIGLEWEVRMESRGQQTVIPPGIDLFLDIEDCHGILEDKQKFHVT